jgi:hypothetical protein
MRRKETPKKWVLKLLFFAYALSWYTIVVNCTQIGQSIEKLRDLLPNEAQTFGN